MLKYRFLFYFCNLHHPSTSRSAAKKNRKYSNGQSNHTYASISSDVGRYEGLTARRGTKDGYEIPLGGAKEGIHGHILFHAIIF